MNKRKSGYQTPSLHINPSKLQTVHQCLLHLHKHHIYLTKRVNRVTQFWQQTGFTLTVPFWVDFIPSVWMFSIQTTQNRHHILRYLSGNSWACQSPTLQRARSDVFGTISITKRDSKVTSQSLCGWYGVRTGRPPFYLSARRRRSSKTKDRTRAPDEISKARGITGFAVCLHVTGLCGNCISHLFCFVSSWIFKHKRQETE